MSKIILSSLLGLGEGVLIAGIAIGLVAFYCGSGVINTSNASTKNGTCSCGRTGRPRAAPVASTAPHCACCHATSQARLVPGH